MYVKSANFLLTFHRQQLNIKKMSNPFFFSKKENPQVIKAKYNIPSEIKLSIEITSDGWFLVTSPELPGFVTQARNAKELLEMVNDGILTYFDVPKREAKEIFDVINIEGHGTIMSKKVKKVFATR